MCPVKITNERFQKSNHSFLSLITKKILQKKKEKRIYSIRDSRNVPENRSLQSFCFFLSSFPIPSCMTERLQNDRLSPQLPVSVVRITALLFIFRCIWAVLNICIGDKTIFVNRAYVLAGSDFQLVHEITDVM